MLTLQYQKLTRFPSEEVELRWLRGARCDVCRVTTDCLIAPSLVEIDLQYCRKCFEIHAEPLWSFAASELDDSFMFIMYSYYNERYIDYEEVKEALANIGVE